VIRGHALACRWCGGPRTPDQRRAVDQERAQGTL